LLALSSLVAGAVLAVVEPPEPSGGTQIICNVVPLGGIKPDMDTIATVIQKRLVGAGLDGALVDAAGTDLVVVEVPTTDAAVLKRVRHLIWSAGTGRFELRVVADPKADRDAVTEWGKTGKAPEGWHEYSLEKKGSDAEGITLETLLIRDDPELTGKDVARVAVVIHEEERWINAFGKANVDIYYKDEGVLPRVIRENDGRRLAVIVGDIRGKDGRLVHLGKLYSAPEISGPGETITTIWGGLTQEEAENLKIILEAGQLSLFVRPLMEREIPPW